MVISQRHRRSSSLCSSVALLVLTASQAGVRANASQPAETRKPDCGVNALFILLHLERRQVTLAHLESVLPPRHKDGFSMQELSTAAGSLGLALDGVQFARGEKPLDRPAIAFLRDAQGGHFTVLRPIGTSGTMVQVIDPPHVPWITDYDRLFVSRVWTGRILLPRDPWAVRYAAPLILAGLGITLASFSIWRCKRASRSGVSDVPTAA